MNKAKTKKRRAGATRRSAARKERIVLAGGKVTSIKLEPKSLAVLEEAKRVGWTRQTDAINQALQVWEPEAPTQ